MVITSLSRGYLAVGHEEEQRRQDDSPHVIVSN